MAFKIPRVTITADFSDDRSLGTVSMHSVGYGLHQAWIYATMFGGTSVFGLHPYVSDPNGSHLTLTYLVSILMFAIFLLFASATNQRLAHLWSARRTAIAGGVLTCVGTLLLVPINSNAPIEVLSGIATGIGTAILIVFWGAAFARSDSTSIVMNTAVAVFIAVVIYALFVQLLPYPFGGLVVALLPLAELSIILKTAPTSQGEGEDVPVFAPLPIKAVRFLARFGVPTFAFGIVLGMLRQMSIQTLLPSSFHSSLTLMVASAGLTSVLLFITVTAVSENSRWSRYFRPLVPFIAVTLLTLPFLQSTDVFSFDLLLLMGYMSFEALMWIFFADLSQRFRISPVLVFGWGRGLLAVAGLLGSFVAVYANYLSSISPFGEHGIVMLLLFVMMVAYVILPGEREIKAIIEPSRVFGAREDTAMATSSREGGAKRPAIEPAAQDGGELLLGAPANAAATRTGARNEQLVPPVEDGAPAAIAEGAVAEADAAETARTAQPATSRAASRTSTSSAPAASKRAQAETLPDTFTAKSKPISARERLARASMPLSAAAVKTEDAAERKNRFRAKCEVVANTYLLSRREIEVMFYLAKGYNSAYIQEKLFISEGTAKTHMRHIYRKLNIHSQQELIRMVESAEVE